MRRRFWRCSKAEEASLTFEEKKDAAESSFDEVKEQIKSQLKQQKQGDAYSKKVAELTEKYKEK